LCAAVCCRCLSISLSVCDLHFAKCVMMHDVHWWCSLTWCTF
jgi:hypothetical protein